MAENQEPRHRVRAVKRLSAIKVAKVKTPGLYEDGAGLRLLVTEKGVKRWAMRVTIDGRRVERGLGVWPTVTLEDARRQAEEFRRAARRGLDARSEARIARGAHSVTVRDAIASLFDVRRRQLSNAKHIQQWENTMRDFVFPVIGGRPVAEVTPAEVLQILRPIWFAKPETASRVLQRLRATFDSAILRGTRERANPCIGVAAELGTKHRSVTHHAALQWRAVPAFVQKLRAVGVSGRQPNVHTAANRQHQLSNALMMRFSACVSMLRSTRTLRPLARRISMVPSLALTSTGGGAAGVGVLGTVGGDCQEFCVGPGV